MYIYIPIARKSPRGEALLAGSILLDGLTPCSLPHQATSLRQMFEINWGLYGNFDDIIVACVPTGETSTRGMDIFRIHHIEGTCTGRFTNVDDALVAFEKPPSRLSLLIP